MPKKRCANCSKKLKANVLSFSCKCKNLYCFKCYCPEVHSCTFDYLKENQEKLSKVPSANFKKIDKIN